MNTGFITQNTHTQSTVRIRAICILNHTHTRILLPCECMQCIHQHQLSLALSNVTVLHKTYRHVSEPFLPQDVVTINEFQNATFHIPNVCLTYASASVRPGHRYYRTNSAQRSNDTDNPNNKDNIFVLWVAGTIFMPLIHRCYIVYYRDLYFIFINLC